MALAVRMTLYLTFAALSVVVEGTLPWDSHISHPVLKTADVVSFDPLSLLAILWNPRASASAARLYMQPDRKTFRWPHMMQIGAVLVPVSMLVNHLTSNYHSIHPGVDMCSSNIDSLDVKSTIGAVRPGADSLFSKLPVSSSDSVLVNTLNFKPSAFPSNDMMVVHIEEFDGSEGSLLRPSRKTWIEMTLVLCTEWIMGLIVLCGTIFSALLGDLWAVVLFASYLFHWVASTAISFRQLVIRDPNLDIQHDKKTVFAVYARPSGGLIIFKGTQSTLERWARSKWVFETSIYNLIITGFGLLRLGFLGMLLYSSAAELWLTVLTQGLQTATFYGIASARAVQSNDRRYKSIIQASLGLDKDHRVDKLRWIDLDLLPTKTVFQAMVSTLDSLNSTAAIGTEPDDLTKQKSIFDDACQGFNEKDKETQRGVWGEIQSVWEQRTAEETQPAQVDRV